MPDVRNCRRCGKIFNYIGGPPICPICREEDEKDFRRVKDYLYENPGSSMSEVATQLDISIDKIKRFLKEGRLEIVEGDSNLFLDCERCGKAISTGRFCNECEKELSRDFSITAQQMGETIIDNRSDKRSTGLRYLSKDEFKK